MTGQEPWLQQATAAAEFIVQRFRNATGGYNASPTEPPRLQENIRVTRFFNLLAHHTGRTDLLQEAQHGMRFVGSAAPLSSAPELSGALLADDELGRDPLRFAIVGAQADGAARALLHATLSVPGAYQRLDWWDPARGPPPDAALPLLSRAALYVCAGGHCTPPAHEAERLPELMLQLAIIPD